MITTDYNPFVHSNDGQIASEWAANNLDDFAEAVVFGSLYELAGKRNVEIDLSEIMADVARTVAKFNAIQAGLKALDLESVKPNLDKKNRKLFVKTLSALENKGFIEILSSKSWKNRVVNVYKVWS